MRRYRFRQTHAGREYFPFGTPSQPPHRFRVVVVLDAGLDRLPVTQWRQGAISAQQRSRSDGLTGASIGTSDEDAFHTAVARASVAAKRFRISSVSASFTEIRRRAVPRGTVGGRTARTSKPAACSSCA